MMDAKQLRRKLLFDRHAFRADAHMPSNIPTRLDMEAYLPETKIADIQRAYEATTEGEHE